MVQLTAPGTAGQFCYRNRSESSAPKTPPSHGLTGFVAIESVAKKGAKQTRIFANRAAAKGNEEAAKGLKKSGKRGWFGAVFDAMRPTRRSVTDRDTASKQPARFVHGLGGGAGDGSPVLLQKKKSKFKDLKNASITRF